MQRRQLLAALPVAALAGCSTALDDGDEPSQPSDAANDSADGTAGTPTDSDCEVAKSLLSAAPVTLTAEQRTHVVPVVVSEQPESVTNVLERAIDGEEITACPTGPTSDTLETLTAAVDGIEETIQRQREGYDGDPPHWIERTGYLRRENELFVCRARHSDVVVSIGTPPDDAPSA